MTIYEQNEELAEAIVAHFIALGYQVVVTEGPCAYRIEAYLRDAA